MNNIIKYSFLSVIRQIFLLFLMLFSVLVIQVVTQENAFAASVDSPTLLPKTPIGALVMTQSAWHTQNSQFLANPASLMKLITATLAAVELGKDYRFKTHLLYDETKLKKGRLSGPLTLVMQGDPSFTVDNLQKLLRKAKKKGIKKITKLDIDVSHYSGHQWAVGQVWNDHGVCFAAPASAAIINRNCVFGNIKTGRIGEKTRLYTTASLPLKIDSQVITVADVDADKCDFLLKVVSNNYYRLTGCLSDKHKQIPLGFSVNKPNVFLANIVQQEIKKLGLASKLKVRIIESRTEPLIEKRNHQIFTHVSKNVGELVVRMLHRSDNLVADTLFKEAGYQYIKRKNDEEVASGSYLAGEMAALEMLQRFNIKTEHLVLRDGSGLSRENLLFVDTFYQLLTVWLSDHKYNWLVEALPSSGESGTLKDRESFADGNLKGKIIAKTGSMQGVSNLAGYVKLNERLLPFVLMVNQLSRSDNVSDGLSEQEIRLFAWEQSFLQLSRP